jgi:mycoredoxin-dependent peroxiredoxin
VSVDVGDEAPDFELQDQERQPVRLSSFRGSKNVVVVFYPMSFTPTCQGELCAIRDSLPDFDGDDVQTLAISCDTSAVHKRWADEEGYRFPILADFWPHGEVARTYGVFDDERGLALRGTFIVDKQGKVAYKVVNAIKSPRDLDEYRSVLAGL